jgi:hypothetical protein
MSIGADPPIQFRCEICGREFAPMDGGKCRRCSRTLCRDHFSALAPEPVCVFCRPLNESSAPQSSGSHKVLHSFLAAAAGSVVGAFVGSLAGESTGFFVAGAIIGEAAFLFFTKSPNDRSAP